jgi:hypothetical protein
MRLPKECTGRSLALVAALAAGAGCDGSRKAQDGPPGDGTGELQWARVVAEDFLTAMVQGNRDAGSNLLSKGFETRLREGDLNPARTTPLPVLLGNVWLGAMWRAYGGELSCYEQLASFEIRGQSLAPDRKEAAFEGVVKGKDGKEFRFRVRVVPDGESGRWRVDSIVVTA